jgi:hypothetical protein
MANMSQLDVLQDTAPPASGPVTLPELFDAWLLGALNLPEHEALRRELLGLDQEATAA